MQKMAKGINAMSQNYGFVKGEICGREGCEGIIDSYGKEGSCSCHINPPCSYCTEISEFCPKCGWDGKEEENENYIEIRKKQNNNDRKIENEYRQRTIEDLDNTKIQWIVLSHTHFSMKCVGVCPPQTSKEAVRELVKGTFGGRFESFGGGKFTYIAYTD